MIAGAIVATVAAPIIHIRSSVLGGMSSFVIGVPEVDSVRADMRNSDAVHAALVRPRMGTSSLKVLPTRGFYRE